MDEWLPVGADTLTDDEKRHNVIRLAFAGDERRYGEFCEVVRDHIPVETTVVLRGSAVTGCCTLVERLALCLGSLLGTMEGCTIMRSSFSGLNVDDVGAIAGAS